MASFHQSIALDSPIRSLHISFVYNSISMAPRFADLKITLWLSAKKEYRNSVYSVSLRKVSGRLGKFFLASPMATGVTIKN